MSILVLAEHSNTHLGFSTRPTLTAAKELASKTSSDIHVLVIGHGCNEAANQAANLEGVAKVLIADSPVYEHSLGEEFATLLAEIAQSYSHVVVPSNTFGKNILPRTAALLDIQPISDVITIESEDTFVRPIYAGNALAKVKSHDAKKLISIRTTAFSPTEEDGTQAEIISLPNNTAIHLSTYLGADLSQSDRPDLATAKRVVSGGRGLQSKENFQIIESLATTLGAAVGASRAAVDAGFVPNDYQVGQTGKVVAPDLYIAIGISGAVQHLAGMKDSKVIVAINKDPDAPIFQIADYGLVGDLFEIVPKLEAALKSV